MGWFGKKKSKDADDYMDVEDANANLPIAVAVFPDASPVPSAPPQSQVQQQQAALITLPAAPPLPSQQTQYHQVVPVPPKQLRMEKRKIMILLRE